MEIWRSNRRIAARLAGILSNRALLPVQRKPWPTSSRPYSSSTMVAPGSGADLVKLHHDRVARLTNAGRGSATALFRRARRRHLAPEKFVGAALRGRPPFF